MFWLITGALCFFLFRRFISKLEIRYYREWEPIKLPLWIWSLVVIICIIPVINFAALIYVVVFIVGDTRSNYANFRFKEGQNKHWINKLIDFMSKEY